MDFVEQLFIALWLEQVPKAAAILLEFIQHLDPRRLAQPFLEIQDVAAELAEKCEIQLAYAIGVAEPVSIRVESFGTGKMDEELITKAIRKTFSLTHRAIIEYLRLRRPIFLNIFTIYR